MKVRLATEHLSLGLVRLENVRQPVEWDDTPPHEPEGDIQVARGMYRAIGVDPTRNRPSSEALLRRIRKGIGLPRINPLVDALNHCSVKLLLPFGGYDLDKTVGDAEVRVGEEGEGFEGLGKPWVNVGGRYTIVDDEGPFGNPSMDSRRTMLTEATRRALIVVFAPPDHPHDRLGWVAEFLAKAVNAIASTEVVR